ncbi:hypothetical protein BU15DRAFT_59117 [Melanogaster broomeanus]|nr:hypothetical protein BU15DRAFT_59117 [Melanogaster broomeanus]
MAFLLISQSNSSRLGSPPQKWKSYTAGENGVPSTTEMAGWTLTASNCGFRYVDLPEYDQNFPTLDISAFPSNVHVWTQAHASLPSTHQTKNLKTILGPVTRSANERGRSASRGGRSGGRSARTGDVALAKTQLEAEDVPTCTTRSCSLSPDMSLEEFMSLLSPRHYCGISGLEVGHPDRTVPWFEMLMRHTEAPYTDLLIRLQWEEGYQHGDNISGMRRTFENRCWDGTGTGCQSFRDTSGEDIPEYYDAQSQLARPGAKTGSY